MKAIFDIALDCDIPLSELRDTTLRNEVVKVRKGSSVKPVTKEPDWLHHWVDSNNDINLSCAKQADAYILRFPGDIDFVISACGSTIKYFPEPGLAPATLRHHLLDQVIPRVLGHRGKLIIHASAVTLPNGKSIAFIGDSGLGKSTLAASFHQHGATLLTDDCLLLNQKGRTIFGNPNYYGVRLFDDSAEAIFDNSTIKVPVFENSPKSRLLLPEKGACTEICTQDFSAFFFLTDQGDNGNGSDEVLIEPLKGAKGLISLINQTFLLDVTNKSLIERQFQNTQQLFDSRVSMYSLQFSRSYENLTIIDKKIKRIMV